MKDKLQQFAVSHHSLKILAALLWYIGSIILLLNGASLLIEADVLKPEEGWPWQVAVLGMLLGSLKARFIFNKSCQKNLDRIATIVQPRIWQFFSPEFFVALTFMILVGTMFSKLAQNNYAMLISVALLDISIGIALLGSSYIFWKQKVFIK